MTNIQPIYLDYAATTPVDPRVLEKMKACLSFEEGFFGNAASSHFFGRQAEGLIEAARVKVAQLLGVVPRNIIFTSGATESINLALKGVAYGYQERGKHIVTCASEHKAVLDSCHYLEKTGFSVTYLQPKANGLVDLEALKQAFRKDTILVSLMHVNNETGVVQDIHGISQLTRERGIFFHVDAAQSVGKLPFTLAALPVDLLSLTAHKFYGPKGMGVLYVGDNPRVRLAAQIHGGGQERHFRAGTLATHQIIGLGEACHIVQQELLSEIEAIRALRDCFWQGLQDLPEVFLNTDLNLSVPHILNIRFEGMRDGDLLSILEGVAASAASACQATHLSPSHVLQSMGLSKEAARQSIRFSFGRFTMEADIDQAILLIREQYLNLRGKQ